MNKQQAYKEWLTLYNECRVIKTSDIHGNNKEVATELNNRLEKIAHHVECAYSVEYPYYDYELWTQDKQYGIRVFYNKRLQLQKDFYGYISMDDKIYVEEVAEDLTSM